MSPRRGERPSSLLAPSAWPRCSSLHPRAPASLPCGVAVVCGISVHSMCPHPSPFPTSWSPRLCASWLAPHISCAQGAVRCDLGYLCCVLFCLLKYFKRTDKKRVLLSFLNSVSELQSSTGHLGAGR